MRQVSSNGTLSMNERKKKNTPSFLRCQSASAVNTPTMYALKYFLCGNDGKLADLFREVFIMQKNTNWKEILFSKTLAKKNLSHKIAYIAIMTAFVVIANMFEFKLADTQFSLTIVASALTGIIIGPIFGFAACFLGDLVGFLYNSAGYMYMPWVGLSMGMTATIAGFINAIPCQRKLFAYLKLAVICLGNFFLCTIAINTTAFWVLYSKVDYFTYLVARIFVQGQIWNSLFNFVLLFVAVPALSRIRALKIRMDDVFSERTRLRKWVKIVGCVLLAAMIVGVAVVARNNAKQAEFKQQVQAYRDAKMTMYQEENILYADYQVDVAFLGDSLTDGYDVKNYYSQYLVSNRGIGGDTTIGLEERMQVSLYDLKPKVAVMLIGANNMETMFDNYENILKGFQENLPNTKIILLSLTSMSGEWGKKNQLAAYNNVKIKMLAEKYGFAFVDLYSALMNLETGEIYPEYTTDGGHLTAEGYRVFTDTLTPFIESQLALWEAENLQ